MSGGPGSAGHDRGMQALGKVILILAVIGGIFLAAIAGIIKLVSWIRGLFQ